MHMRSEKYPNNKIVPDIVENKLGLGLKAMR
jgi:hypothetical protein